MAVRGDPAGRGAPATPATSMPPGLALIASHLINRLHSSAPLVCGWLLLLPVPQAVATARWDARPNDSSGSTKSSVAEGVGSVTRVPVGQLPRKAGALLRWI